MNYFLPSRSAITNMAILNEGSNKPFLQFVGRLRSTAWRCVFYASFWMVQVDWLILNDSRLFYSWQANVSWCPHCSIHAHPKESKFQMTLLAYNGIIGEPVVWDWNSRRLRTGVLAKTWYKLHDATIIAFAPIHLNMVASWHHNRWKLPQQLFHSINFTHTSQTH